MLNQWHFKGNWADSCQSIVTRQKLHSEGHCAGSRDVNILASLFLLFSCFVYIQCPLLPLTYFLESTIQRSCSACHQRMQLPGEAPRALELVWALQRAVSSGAAAPALGQGCSKPSQVSFTEAFTFYQQKRNWSMSMKIYRCGEKRTVTKIWE